MHVRANTGHVIALEGKRRWISYKKTSELGDNGEGNRGCGVSAFFLKFASFSEVNSSGSFGPFRSSPLPGKRQRSHRFI